MNAVLSKEVDKSYSKIHLEVIFLKPESANDSKAYSS
jgi:hypothetical protein